MELYFIGDEFYQKSSTMMSSIYHIGGGRSDWGKVKVALRNGETVTIRPANKQEMLEAKSELLDIIGKFPKEKQ